MVYDYNTQLMWNLCCFFFWSDRKPTIGGRGRGRGRGEEGGGRGGGRGGDGGRGGRSYQEDSAGGRGSARGRGGGRSGGGRGLHIPLYLPFIFSHQTLWIDINRLGIIPGYHVAQVIHR
jgi:hypothetical protein